MANGRIRTIKLSDGQVYTVFDNLALHLGPNNEILCGDETVDRIVIGGYATIESIDDVPPEIEIDNVLTQANSGEIKKRSTNYLLKDIGGYSLSIDNNGTLIGKLGK